MAWLGSGLLAINLWAGALIPGGALAAAESDIGLEICTLHGVVKVDASGHELPPTEQRHSAELCQCCLSLLDGGFGPSTAPALPAPTSVEVVLTVATPPAEIPVSRPRDSAQPRAPPAV